MLPQALLQIHCVPFYFTAQFNCSVLKTSYSVTVCSTFTLDCIIFLQGFAAVFDLYCTALNPSLACCKVKSQFAKKNPATSFFLAKPKKKTVNILFFYWLFVINVCICVQVLHTLLQRNHYQQLLRLKVTAYHFLKYYFWRFNTL